MMKIGRFFQFVGLILLAAGAQPAATAVYQWSTTAANNATADPNINWAEGMSPSSVNDSARAMMQQIQLWRKDSSGSNLQAFGGPTTYTLTSNEGFANTTVMAGAALTFYTPSGTNGADATLNVDGLGAFPLISSIGTALPAGALNGNSQYTVSFVLAGAWAVQNYYGNSFNIPLGGLLSSTISTPPNANFVAAGGQCISTATYAVYWAAIGSPASGACPGGQFAVLDARGRALVGLDTLGPLGAAGRLTNVGTGCGTAMTSLGASCVNGLQNRPVTIANLNTFTPTVLSASVNLAPGSALSAIRNWVTGGGGSSDTTHVSTGSNTGSDAGTFTSSLSGVLTPSITMNSLGSGTALPTVDPNAAVYIYIRVL